MYYNKRKKYMNLFWIALGAVLLGLSSAGVISSSYYGGMGGGLIAVGALQLMRIRKYNSDPEYKEKIDIELSDERSSFIRMKTWSVTGYIMVLATALGSFIAYILGREQLGQTLSFVTCAILLLYWIVFWFVNKKY